MRTYLLQSFSSSQWFLGAVSALALANVACGGQTTTFVKSETALGRVVVYRNGVAYFERNATVEGDTLRMSVPPDKVDDFLKSLTVTDVRTGQAAPVSYPTSSGDGTLEMKIALGGAGPHQVRLAYVTEAPAWKPSYRLTLGKGQVNFQAWAIVDNTSGEDWERVKLGVGSSSAMSFRFNLRGVRLVDRQTLRADDLFAQAPPTGAATYDGRSPQVAANGQRVWGEFDDRAIAKNEEVAKEQERYKRAPSEPKAPMAVMPNKPSATQSRGPGAGGGLRGGLSTQDASGSAGYGNGAIGGNARNARPEPPPAPKDMQQSQFENAVNTFKAGAQNIVIEGYAQAGDGDKNTASLERANKVRDQLIRSGVDANRVIAIGKGEQVGRNGGVRIVEVPQAPPTSGTAPPTGAATTTDRRAADAGSGDPIGTSHFESGSMMTVPKGHAGMVSIFKGETPGDVVYLYDAESQRGNAQFPFRAVRFTNPTDSQLEQGPVSVFGEGRFIGEGLAEPIPAHATAFIPFALDRQLVVEKKDAEHDEIARVITVQRGVFSTEIKHTKKRGLTFFNRSGDPAVVYVRHTLTPGYKFTDTPKLDEKVGGAQLFRIEVPGHGKTEISIDEATPVFRTTDIRTNAGLELVRVHLTKSAVDPRLKTAVDELLKLNTEMANIDQRITLVREQQAEYRARMDELHVQLVTLKAVKTAGPMMTALEKKMQEMSDKVSKATVELVTLQEKLMVTRIKFQDGVAELSLEKK
jgi:hypothetical protein